MAVILDGKAISAKFRQNIKEETAALKEKTGKAPGIAVILAGDDAASSVYVNSKEKAAIECGFYSVVERISADVTTSDVLKLVEKYNNDEKIHGILVQLPLPSACDEKTILRAIRAEKDVDGFHPVNVGNLMIGRKSYLPCTPHGVLVLLKTMGIPTSGRHVVIVGRSNIVGKPLSVLLLRKEYNATVTVCHTGTKDMALFTRQADILIAAAGCPGMITADMVKPGAAVIDVGVNRIPDSSKKSGFRLCGDVDFEAVKEKASYITPVPRGVGPMTIAMLMMNTVEAARNSFEKRQQDL